MELIITLRTTVETEVAAKLLTDKIIADLPKEQKIKISSSVRNEVDSLKVSG